MSSKPWPQEAKEVAQDVEGRWFGFCLTMSSLVLVEKKSCADHMSKLECLDAPTRLDDLLKQMEDLGEVTGPIVRFVSSIAQN